MYRIFISHGDYLSKHLCEEFDLLSLPVANIFRNVDRFSSGRDQREGLVRFG